MVVAARAAYQGSLSFGSFVKSSIALPLLTAALAISGSSWAQEDLEVAGEEEAEEGAEAAEEAAPKRPLTVAVPPPAPPPRAPEPPASSRPGLGDCTFLSEPTCELSLVAEMGLAGGQVSTFGVVPLFHGFLETGLLVPSRGTEHLHLGPVFELAVETHEHALAWLGSPRLRLRYFAGGTHFVVEGSAGPQFQRYAMHDVLTTGTRAGFAADFSFGYRGIVGAWIQGAGLRDFAGDSGNELRWVAGLRANLMGWAVALGAMGNAF